MSATSLFIRNLHDEVTEELLTQKFREMLLKKLREGGESTPITFTVDISESERGNTAIANFKNCDDAEYVKKNLNNVNLHGKPLQIRWNAGDPKLQETKKANIIIKNLDKSVDKEALKKECKRFGKILYAQIPEDDKGRSKGYAYVNFESEAQAMQAIKQLHKTQIGKTIVYVEKFKPRNERANSSKADDNSRHSKDNFGSRQQPNFRSKSNERGQRSANGSRSNYGMANRQISGEQPRHFKVENRTGHKGNVNSSAPRRHFTEENKIFRCDDQKADFILKHYRSCLPRVSKVFAGVKISGEKEEVENGIKLLEDEQFLKSGVVFRAVKLLEYFNSSKEWSRSRYNWEKNHQCSIMTEQNNTPTQVSDHGTGVSGRPSTIQYNVYQGDISDAVTDAIVIGVFNDFDLTQGKIAPAVLKKAGQNLQIECSSNPLISTDCLRVTMGYNLSCKYVFHLVTPTSAQDLTKRVKIVLDEAQKFGITSISFPTIGAGGIGLGVQQVASAMRKAFQEFEEENRLVRCSVKIINVVVFEPSVVVDFQQHAVPDGSSSNVPMHSAVSQTYGSGEEEWRVTVTSLSQTINDKVVEKLEQFKRRLIGKEEVVNSNIAKLEENEIYEIKRAADDCGATIAIDKTSTITIFGLLENVKQVKKKVDFLLGQLADAIKIAKVCVWKMENASGTFEPFPLRVSHKITKNYEMSKTSPFYVLICGEKYWIDLANMTYSGEKKNGKIKTEASSDLPPEWAPMNGEPTMLVALSPGSSEYNNVLALFQNSNPRAHVQTIERIQNPDLYHAYQLKKKDVEKNMLTNEPVSRELFHGTTDDIVVDDICRHGFDRGYAGKNATAYGKGSYFAVNSSYSLSYCDQSGLKRMFLALVLTGNYYQGHSSYVSAPLIGSSVRKYDSVVDNPSSPNMFVVFKDSSVYPNYLITLM